MFAKTAKDLAMSTKIVFFVNNALTATAIYSHAA